jgi:hypothetical protein
MRALLVFALLAFFAAAVRSSTSASTAFGPNCTAEGPGLTEATTFEKAPFTITTYDEEGERFERGGAQVVCKLRDDLQNTVATVTCTDNDNGTYSCFYIAFVSGKFTLEILVQKANIKNSPFHPSVKPHQCAAATSCNECLQTTSVSAPCSYCQGTVGSSNAFGICLHSYNIDELRCGGPNGNQLINAGGTCPIDNSPHDNVKDSLQAAVALSGLSVREKYLVIFSHIIEKKNAGNNHVSDVFFSLLGDESEVFNDVERLLLCEVILDVWSATHPGVASPLPSTCSIGPVAAPAPPPTQAKRSITETTYKAEIIQRVESAVSAHVAPVVTLAVALVALSQY